MAMGDMYSEQDCTDAVLLFNKETGKTTLKEFKKFQQYRRPCFRTILRKMTWNTVCIKAGIK